MGDSSRRLIPLPGAIDGRTWKVADAGNKGATQTNLNRRTMAVPMEASEEARQAQLHELAHVAFSAADPGKLARQSGLPVEWIEGAEDARLTALLGNLGLPQDAELLPPPDPRAERLRASGYAAAAASYYPANHPRARLARVAKDNDASAALLVASFGTGDAGTIREAIAADNPNGEALCRFVDSLVQDALVNDNPTDPEWTTRTARTIRDALAAATAESEAAEGEGEGEGGEGEGGGGEGKEAWGDGLDDLFEGIETPATPSAATKDGGGRPLPTSATATTAGMNLVPASSSSAQLAARQVMQAKKPVTRKVANPGDNPGAAIGTGTPNTDGTAKIPPSIAAPPARDVVKALNTRNLMKTGETAQELASHVVAPRRGVGERWDGRTCEYVAFEGLDFDGCRWGTFVPELDTLKPKLSVRQGRAFLPKAKRAGIEHGSIPTAMHRLTIDGRVFRGPRMRNGNAGAVLIDLSGSMSLTMQNVRDILDVMPAGIVAAYSGEPNHLAILARKGMMVDDATLRATMRRMGGNNSIDGPCLHWLAGQRGPRFWISDGGITGDADSGVSVAMRADVVQTCIKARILRVGSAAEVVARFGKARR